ncbi:MAG: Flp pilus assembly protein CpaB [Candidatus Omnitrophica bacterium]|nr:Flp pilus assembly protein CpaB [Candidatus Omnitrophota bacterium]
MPIKLEKQQIILIAGVALALIAIVLVNSYITQQKQEAQAQAKKALASMQADQTAVLVAKQGIPKGTAINPSMLEAQVVPNKFVQPNAATSLDRVADMVTMVDIAKGEQIVMTKLSNIQSRGAGDLAGLTPVGKRAITVSVDNISSLAGLIKPGDYVDVISMIAIPVQGPSGEQLSQMAVIPLFQNVLVLAVGQDTGGLVIRSRYSTKGAESGAPSGLITLALGPQEASLIAFVQEQGRIRLVLRSPADAQVSPMQPASWDTFFKYIMPSQEQIPLPMDQTEYIEVYRGVNKDKMPLSK